MRKTENTRRLHPLKNKLATTLAALIGGILVLTGVVTATPAQATSYTPGSMSYVVIPHPDDEWQAWSLIERSSGNYKVFMLMTQGDQTGYCQPRWTKECTDRRVSSFLGFLTEASKSDPTVPGDFENLGARGPFPTRGYTLTRDDGGNVYPASTAPTVYLDKQGRGAVVVFDLGDGDLTESEVKWAIETTRDNRQALGINTTARNWNALGAYYNKNYGGCYVYAHPDHYAVHRALYHHNYGFGYQAAATCSSDPEVSRKQTVTSGSVQAIWNNGPGAFPNNYGWLGSNNTYGNQVWFGNQSFWVRHKN